VAISVHPTSAHVVPGGPVILLALVIIGVVVYLVVSRRRS
jgi:hypothetical protein